MGPNPFLPSQEEIPGRYLASAYIVAQHGIGMDSARKAHAHEPVGEFWTSLARIVIEHMRSSQCCLPGILLRFSKAVSTAVWVIASLRG